MVYADEKKAGPDWDNVCKRFYREGLRDGALLMALVIIIGLTIGGVLDA